MSSKSFITISNEEGAVIYKEILLHSDRKWENGKKRSESGDFGEATSYAIISIEELVKALVLFFDSKGFEFRKVKGMDTIFKNHKIRFLIAYAMFVMNVFGTELFKFLQKVKSNPNELEELIEKMKSGNLFFKMKMKFYLLRKFIMLRREFDLFSKMDVFRQEGFYCDYDDYFKTPLSISQKDYYELYKRLEQVRIIGKGILEEYSSSNQEVINHLEKLRIRFKKEKYYDQIENSLSKLRQSRKGPFEFITQSFS